MHPNEDQLHHEVDVEVVEGRVKRDVEVHAVDHLQNVDQDVDRQAVAHLVDVIENVVELEEETHEVQEEPEESR